MCFSTKASNYFLSLQPPGKFSGGIKVINPYESKEVRTVVKQFFNKFYSDNKERLFLIGINPGRFGGGVTGISFTDPVALREYCGISNNLGNKKELSSKFIYQVINKFGGVQKFFSCVLMTALFPLALISNGKNFNYYDNNNLFAVLKSEILKSIKTQIQFGARKDMALIIGKKNAEYFNLINDELGFFCKTIVLDHPRFIMQYRLKHIDNYIDKYLYYLNK